MDYAKQLESLVGETEYSKKSAQLMGAALKAGKFRKFLEPALSMRDGKTVTGYCGTSGRSLYIGLTVNELEGFTDTRLSGILSVFEYLNPSSTNMDENAGNISKSIRYYYTVPMGDVGSINVTVEVTGYVKETSETCKRVQIGMTEGKPQPIYKIVCEGEDSPADNPADAPDGEPNHEPAAYTSDEATL